jgi:hypothetical protein
LNSGWRKESEITLFNRRGAVLETKDIVGNTFSSVKYGYTDRFVTAECSDAKYTEFAASGAEDLNTVSGFYGGEVKFNVAVATETSTMPFVHTGNKAVALGVSGKGFEYKVSLADLVVTRQYMARVWMFNNGNTSGRLYFEVKDNTNNAVVNSGSVGFTPANSQSTHGYVFHRKDWALLTLDSISVNPALTATNPSNYTLFVRCENTSTTAGSVAYFDDFRFHPEDAPITTYVYDAFTGLPTHVLNSNGFYDRIQYDGLGRVFRVFNETVDGEKQVSEINRNYYRFSQPTANPFDSF